MSEAPHGAPIKTPGQLIAVVIASFVVPIAIIVLFATYANHAFRTGAGTDGLSDEAVAKRIAPSPRSTSRTRTRRASTKRARKSTRPSA